MDLIAGSAFSTPSFTNRLRPSDRIASRFVQPRKTLFRVHRREKEADMLHSSFGRRPLVLATSLLATVAIVALAFTPAVSNQMRPLLQSLVIFSCSSSGPCQEGKNSSTGSGLEGISAKGSGVIGQTTSSGSHAGVLGQDKSTSPNEAGVEGTSTNGSGLVGLSTNGPGMMSSSTTFDGVESRTFHNSSTTFSGASGVFGGDGSSDGGHLNAGVTGSSFNGIGVEGVSSKWVGVNAVGGFFFGTEFPALSIVGNNTGSGNNDLVDACPPLTADPCDEAHAVFEVNSLGDVFGGSMISDGGFGINGTGSYTKNGACVAGCAVATAATLGRAVTTYASMTSQPTVEDFGEAQLVDGRAYVRLNSDFANVVDQRAAYLVFITPEGDANLYVASKTRNGFEVDETHGGRSTILFSYRIVAKPFGSHGARLPMVTVPKMPTHRLQTSRPPMPL